MKLRLTDTGITSLKVKGDQSTLEARDTVIPGLVLRVGKKGDKVWEIILPEGKSRRRHRLGLFPSMTTKEARLAAEAAKLAARSRVASSGLKTVEDLFREYEDAKSPTLKSWKQIKGSWDLYAGPRIGHIRLSDITIHHGNDLRRYVTGKSTANRAAHVIRCIRPMFAWAVKNSMLDVNHWRDLVPGETTKQRDRVLAPREWQALWKHSFEEEYPFGPFLRVLMLSAQRLTNVAQMRWSHLDFEENIWVIPREMMKAGRTHELPLSGKVIKILSDIPCHSDCDFVFTTKGNTAITPGSTLKARLDSKLNFNQPWVFHDIRRSAATHMTTGGVTRFMVQRVLAHADQSVTATYDRSEYRREKLDALEILAATVSGV